MNTKFNVPYQNINQYKGYPSNSMGYPNQSYSNDDERFIGPFLVPFILGGLTGAAINGGGFGNNKCCQPQGYYQPAPVIYQQPVVYQNQSYPQPYPMPYPIPYEII
ncbi:MAG: hypothetical protein R3Y21_04755 [Mycoplasmatota bacterium]